MNSMPILIIGAPAVLAVIAFKKAQKGREHVAKPKPTKDWNFPPKWRPPASKTGERP